MVRTEAAEGVTWVQWRKVARKKQKQAEKKGS